MLTTRERECLQGRAEGLMDKEVARVLHLDTKTVKTHLERARRRLNAKNTAHAAAKAFVRGEIV